MLLERARKVFSASRLPVIASFATGEVDKVEMVKCVDVNTNTQVIVNSSLHPLSPFTGEPLKKVTKQTVVLSKADILKDFKAIANCSCGTTHAVLSNIASKLEGKKIACTVCSQVLTVKATDIKAEVEDKTMSSEVPADDVQSEEIPLEDVDYQEEGETATTEKPVETEAKQEPKVESSDNKEDPKASDDAAAEASDIEVDMIQTISASAINSGKVDLIPSGGKIPVIYMMYEHRPVATMHRNIASEGVQATFADVRTLSKAFFAAAANGLNEQVVNDFGIEPVVVKVTPDEAVKQAIAKETARVVADYEQKAKDITENFKQSVSIASMMLNKGLIKDKVHPIKAALVTALKRLDIKNPDKIINTVFAKYGEDHLRVILADTYDLMGKDLETRNVVAKIAVEASYQDTSYDSTEDFAQKLAAATASDSSDNKKDEDEAVEDNGEKTGVHIPDNKTTAAVSNVVGLDSGRITDYRKQLNFRRY